MLQVARLWSGRTSLRDAYIGEVKKSANLHGIELFDIACFEVDE